MSDDNRLDPAQLDLLRDCTRVRQIELHDELPSTNDHALDLASREATETPCLIVASRQTAGRGRGANQWWSAPGALTWSLLIDWPANRPLGVPTPISLLAGIAICEALDGLSPIPARLKWPNDVYIANRKVSGVLVEVPPRPAGKLVIGVGVNVNNDFNAAPDHLRQTAVALSQVAGRAFPLSMVLRDILGRLLMELDSQPGGSGPLVDRWRQRCVLTGRTVEVSAGSRSTRGKCLGIDVTGALIVRTPDGDRACHSGIVSQIE